MNGWGLDTFGAFEKDCVCVDFSGSRNVVKRLLPCTRPSSPISARLRVLASSGKEYAVAKGGKARLRGREDGRRHRAGKGGGVLLRAVVLAETLLLVPMSLSSYASPAT